MEHHGKSANEGRSPDRNLDRQGRYVLIHPRLSSLRLIAISWLLKLLPNYNLYSLGPTLWPSFATARYSQYALTLRNEIHMFIGLKGVFVQCNM